MPCLLGHIWVFVTNLAFSLRIPDHLHKSIMITLYDLANIQNKAQKVWELFEKRQWRKFWFRQKKFRLLYRYWNLILVLVADTETRFRLYTMVLKLLDQINFKFCPMWNTLGHRTAIKLSIVAHHDLQIPLSWYLLQSRLRAVFFIKLQLKLECRAKVQNL